MEWDKKRVRKLRDEVIVVLNRIDVYGLEPGTPDGPPWDEYSPEASDMLSILVKRGAITPGEIRAIWLKWFSDDLSGDPDTVARLARELNELLVTPPSQD